MNIEIENIGKIKYADITLEGITIIAGENNTGKSTIGKTVFSLLNNMSDWEMSYRKICIQKLNAAITKLSVKLEKFCLEHTRAVRKRTNRINRLIMELCSNEDFITYVEDYKYAIVQEDKDEANKQMKKQLWIFCQEYVNAYQKNIDDLMLEYRQFFDEWIKNTIVEVRNNVELDERVLQGNVIKQSFVNCFKSQYVTEGKEYSFIKLKDVGSDCIIKLTDTEIHITTPVRFDRNVYFIETPKLFDEINRLGIDLDTKKRLQRIMVPNSFLNIKKEYFSREFDEAEILDEDIPADVDKILEMLRKEMGGQAYYYVKEGIKFKDNKLKTPIKAQNVSTGVKSMAFLEYALRIGAIQKNDVLILDEPEINLHPEWQVSYARVLVLLHKMYGLTILITSHSPYFIRAIECLSDKYDVMDQLNVYLVEQNRKGMQKIDNVMESEYGMTELYDKLSAPLDDLQDEIDAEYE